ncbi:MAG: ABC transporter substrate-binding protein [Pseudoclavibacter sp.]
MTTTARRASSRTATARTTRPMLATLGSILALSLGLTGCAGATPGAEPANANGSAAFPTTIDAPNVAEPVEIAQEPTRIAVLSPDAATALHELGVTDRVIAVPEAATNPALNPYAEEMSGVENVAGGHTSPEPEHVLAWEPDLIVITARHTGEQDASEQLSATGVPVLTLTNGWSSTEAVVDNLEVLGQATGATQQAGELAAEITDGVAGVRERAGEAGETPTVAILSNQAEAPFINAGSSLVAEIVANGGGVNAADAMGIDQTMPVQPEQLVAMNPDYIMLVDVTGKGEESFDSLLGNAAVAALPAIQDARIETFEGNEMYGLAGREVVAASESVLAWLHPELAG